MAWLTALSGFILMAYAGLSLPYVADDDVNFIIGTAIVGAVLFCVGIAVV